MDAKLAQDVADGTITQEQVDQMKAHRGGRPEALDRGKNRGA